MPNAHLYREVVSVTYEYLGPAADRFVTRQVRNHLGKKPENLTRKDLRQLMDWMRLAMGLLSDDMQLVDLYMADLGKLADGNSKVRRT